MTENNIDSHMVIIPQNILISSYEIQRQNMPNKLSVENVCQERFI